MSDLVTPFLGLTKPTVNDEAGEDLWGEKLNTNFDKLDASASTISDDLTVLQGSAVTEAPIDGKPYGRKDADWFDVSTLPVSWDSVTGKPDTFPPTLPIPQVGVTGLVADQATQTSAINANTTAINGKEPAITPGTVNDFWRGDKAWVPLSSITVDAYTKVQADARFAPIVHTHVIADVTGLTSALAGKEPTIAAGTTAQYWRGDKTWVAFPAVPAAGSYVPQTGVNGAANLPTGTTAQRPSPVTGQMRFNSDLTIFEGYNGTAWAGIGGGVYVGVTAPTSPRNGDLWFKSDVALLYVYYDDGNTSQWVVSIPQQSIEGLDARYVAKAGDKMTGTLQVAGTPVAVAMAPNAIVTDWFSCNNYGGNGYVNAAQNNWNFRVAGYGGQFQFVPSDGSWRLLGYASGAAGAAWGSPTTLATFSNNGVVNFYSNVYTSGGLICQPASPYGSFMAMNGAGNAYLTMGLDGGGVGILNHSAPAPAISFQLSGSQYMRLSSNQLLVSGMSGSNYSIDARGAGVLGGIIGFAPSTSYYGICGYYPSYSFYGNGAAYISNGTWTTSDGRFKDIAEASPFEEATMSAIGVVEDIAVRSFSWKGPMAKITPNGAEQFGFVAAEVERVLPIAVMDIHAPPHDEALRAFLNPDATPDEDVTFKGLNHDYLVAVLWQAVQELSARVKQLEGAP